MRRMSPLALRLFAALALALVVTACGSSSGNSSSTAPTAGGSSKTDASMRLGIATWIGFAPLVVADKEGYFKSEGLNLTYTVIDDGSQRFNALKAGQIDGVATTVDAYARINAEGIPTQQVLGFDHSVGADGILAAAGTTAAKLKGQKIGVPTATTSQFFLAKYLQDNGMSLKDVQEVNLTAGDAGATFLAGRIPNAVTYEPYLTKARQKPGAEVLVDSSKYPNLIVDTLGLTPSYVKAHPASVNAFLRAYFRGLADLQTKPDKVYPLLEKYLGLKPSEMAAAFKTVLLYSQQANKAFMTQQLPTVYNDAGKFWVQQGVIKAPQPAAQAVNPSFINGLK